MGTCISKVMSTAACLLLVGACGGAGAQGLSCEALRDRIAANAKWPAGTMRLDIVGKDEASPGRPVGACEQGARRIMAVSVDPGAPAPQAADAAPTPVAPPQPVADAKPEAAEAPAKTAAEVPAPAPERPRARRGAVDEATLQQYRAWIAEARALHPYEDSENRMFKMMLCESNGVADIKSPGGVNVGLFQFNLQTWQGRWNEAYRDQDRTDPKAAIFAAALAWHNRMQSHWPHCNRKTAGEP